MTPWWVWVDVLVGVAILIAHFTYAIRASNKSIPTHKKEK